MQEFIITRDSRLRDVLASPSGHDIIARLLYMTGLHENLIRDSFFGNMKIKDLKKIPFLKLNDSFIDALLEVLNAERETAGESEAKKEKKWWKEAVVYQVYPRSFKDSDGDGTGDLKGVLEKLDYLADLGIDTIWLGPVCDSPNDDNGYDIRDYYRIMTEFGTMEDMEQLIEEAHARGIRILMDLVLNHSSDEHEWFVKALNDPDSKYRDYYFFRKGENGKEPNNWTSLFSGPAWNYYPEQDVWALHLFSSKQMDLNWENEELRKEIYELTNFWLNKGVDGFRLDVINFISKDEGLPDGDPVIGGMLGFTGAEHYFHGPRLDEFLREFRKNTFGNYDSYTVGECAGSGLQISRMLTGDDRGELDTVFNFDHVENPGRNRFRPYTFDLRPMAAELVKWQTEYSEHCWPTVFFENHDLPRMTSKACPDGRHREALSKLLAVMEFTFRGTPYVYMGQEIGMDNCPFPDMDAVRDVESRNWYQKLTEEKHMTQKQAFRSVLAGSRDNARTPMQWDDSPGAGFTTGTPWIMVNPDHTKINVKKQESDPDSVLSFYKTMIRLRKENPALVYGDFIHYPSHDSILVYRRTLGEESWLVEINLTPRYQTRISDLSLLEPVVLSYGRTDTILHPFEANVYRIRK